MTGREQQTLDSFVEFARDAFGRLEEKVDSVDQRVRDLEQTSARAAGASEGQAAAVAHANVVNQRIETTKASRRDSLRTVFTVAASSATIASVVVGLLLTVFHS
jgi:hypothetical protein